MEISNLTSLSNDNSDPRFVNDQNGKFLCFVAGSGIQGRIHNTIDAIEIVKRFNAYTDLVFKLTTFVTYSDNIKSNGLSDLQVDLQYQGLVDSARSLLLQLQSIPDYEEK